ESLQAISDGLFSEELQQSLGLHSISTSQLGRRLSEIPTSFFQSLFLDLVSQIHENTHFNTRRKVTMPLKIIDSRDRKSTRLNSSHVSISYAVFFLKK